MRRIRLESSFLASVLYLPKRRELEVEFRSGEVCRYFDVPRQIYGELLKVPSKGGYFNSNIRQRFLFQRISPVSPVQAGTT